MGDLGRRRSLGLGLAVVLGRAAQLAGEQVLVLGDELEVFGILAGALAGHALLVEDALAAGADLADALHGVQGLRHELAVVPGGDVAAGRELQRAVDRHLLAGLLARDLRPLHLTGLALLREGPLALGPAESECLGCGTGWLVNIFFKAGSIPGRRYHHSAQR